MLLFYLILGSTPKSFGQRQIPPICPDVLKVENYKDEEDLRSYHSIFYNIPKTACFVCAEPECNYYDFYCPKFSTIGEVPLYYNIFEFGLSGKYFPSLGWIEVRVSDSCRFKIYVFPDYEKAEVLIRINECLNKSEIVNCNKGTDHIHLFNFDYEFCLYLSFAFYEKDKLHYATSTLCDKFATRNYNQFTFIPIENPACYLNQHKDTLRAWARFQQNDSRTIDGIPVILPCSPGGFAVDPTTGRFLIGDLCWDTFGEQMAENIGLNFLIRKIYNNIEEDLLFPIGYYRTYERVNPMYLSETLRVKDRKSMASKQVRNPQTGGFRRFMCVLRPQNVSYVIYRENWTMPESEQGYIEAEILEVERIFLASEKRTLPCKVVRNEGNAESIEKLILEFVNPVACFICIRNNLKLPMYNNIFDISINAFIFPPELTLSIEMNEQCQIQIIVKLALEQSSYIVGFRNCLNAKDISCSDLGEELSGQFEYTSNYWCFSIAVAFFESDKMHYGISTRCQAVASIYLDESQFQSISNEACLFNASKTPVVGFEFLRRDISPYEGIPASVPCSPGGYGVDPYTGRFVTGEECYRSFPVGYESSKSLNFILSNIYGNNEDLLFPTKPKVQFNMVPVYINERGNPYPTEKMESQIEKNTVKGDRNRDGCDYEMEYPTETLPCDDLLQPEKFQSPSKDSISYYAHKSSCFLCTKPTCNFASDACNKKSAINAFPLYNNLFEIGIPTNHLPNQTIIRITTTKNCIFKILISYMSPSLSYVIEECVSPDNCTISHSESGILLHRNNYNCFQIALGFKEMRMVNFAHTLLCSQIASFEFSVSDVFDIKLEACHFKADKQHPVAQIDVFQNEARTHDGVPLIVPCSPGGYAVNPNTGKFITGVNCKKLLWDTLEQESGLNYLVDEYFNGNEDVIFPTHSEASAPYPQPIYVKKDGKFLSITETAPNKSENKNMNRKIRKGCTYTETAASRERGNESEVEEKDPGERQQMLTLEPIQPLNPEEVEIGQPEIDNEIENGNANVFTTEEEDYELTTNSTNNNSSEGGEDYMSDACNIDCNTNFKYLLVIEILLKDFMYCLIQHLVHLF